MDPASTIEGLLQRDRAIVGTGLVLLLLLALGQIVLVEKASSEALDAAAESLVLFVMWAIMMVAMMLPTAAPIVLTHAAIQRRQMSSQSPFGATAIFLAGYLLVWTGFSALAAVGQWIIVGSGYLPPPSDATAQTLSGATLLLAGIFQLSELKRACLRHCRSPLGTLMMGWRDGKLGALRMGLRHGLYCVGCCWALMLLMFLAGVAELVVFVLLTTFVLIEKVAPYGDLAGRWAGAAMIVGGCVWVWT